MITYALRFILYFEAKSTNCQPNAFANFITNNFKRANRIANSNNVAYFSLLAATWI